MTAQTTRTVSRAEWTEARKALLAREKAFSVERDALSAARRELPRVKVESEYVFEEASGKRSLLDLFEGQHQLIVYHFMFEPSWDAGCRGCSFVSETFEPGTLAHLRARDTSLVAVSRAPLAKLEGFKKRMGWSFRWLSSAGSEFNYDFGVSFHPEDVLTKRAEYNYRSRESAGDMPGLSVFLREDREIFHTYSTYERGLDLLIGTYNCLDLTPLGRQEPKGKHMGWLRHHDAYEAG
jgi:predicted dithiol-disulfide oxidoreductase (DUF899 family)